jgi:hypothetical protein
MYINPPGMKLGQIARKVVRKEEKMNSGLLATRKTS